MAMPREAPPPSVDERFQPGAHWSSVRVVADHVTIPKAGERLSGDVAVFRTVGAVSLFAVIDAFGHGPAAAEVADAGAAHLEIASLDQSVVELMGGLHRALHGSRGAAAMLCRWTAGRMEGCGVGNVELAALRTKIPVVLTPGIVGGQVRVMRGFDGAAAVGSRFVVYSDGISSRMSSDEIGLLPRAVACRAIMERHRRSHDDATVMIVDVEA
jgi:negative regulator of sigma-B (phosphoserine phosphatase)